VPKAVHVSQRPQLFDAEFALLSVRANLCNGAGSHLWTVPSAAQTLQGHR